MKLYPQIERKLTQLLCHTSDKPWKVIKNSHKWDKRKKHKSERAAARADIEVAPCYRKYGGWEW